MFRPYALFCVLLTLSILALGAYVRVVDAGLGCTDWPGCFGRIIVDATPQPATADTVRTVLATAHRHLAEGLGLAVLLLFATAFRVQRQRLATVLLAFLALAAVAGQAFLGLWAAAWLAAPVRILAHLALGLLTLGLLYRVYLGQRPDADRLPTQDTPGLRWLARASLLALLLQIALGGWTSANYAGLACPDFPTCLGSFNPPVDYAGGFTPSLAPEASSLLSHSARAAIHWAHRLGSVAVFVLLSILALLLTSNPKIPRLSKPGLLLNFLLLAQISLGIGAILLRLPAPIAVAHSTVAALLLLNLLHILFYLRKPAPAEAAAGAEAPVRREAIAPIAEVVLPPVEIPPAALEPAPALFERLKSGLGKTRGGLTGFLANLALGKKAIDRDLLEDIEAQLLMADIGVSATQEIIADLTSSLDRHQLDDVSALTGRLREHLYELLEPVSHPLAVDTAAHKPFVILVVGVNGVGKTTTIGKLAKRLKNQGHSVMLAAGDTFRAAAVEQLQTWGERNDIHVVAQHTGADSASVIFDGVQAAQSRGVDVLIADTAGRLHTKSNLMEELAKIKRIMAKLDPAAPHEVLLVLDAGTGQNAINQAKQFNEAVGLTGLVLTKLDGTAKGGVIFNLAKQFGIPVRYIGVGESIDDLQDFDARQFIDALFAE
ncbi:signal recognition particle-docking protein FtsY [Methylococcus sp. EFPC2]|uniref:signal recognition particle-docking protein FtsY n=1 Tax=Methylococcus sp. EFPC2 TaxID=2812648 RepID=UPI0019679003|nr:signal recognition particle-docking protein FtsY [Methylococcus sp. EFPC2]QSA95886.1 signal recognition particle-docking protein FtsY [Methylococcus sp. EFPC2]